MIEAGGNPNIEDYLTKPKYRLYFNRISLNWWCFTWLNPLDPKGTPAKFVGVCGLEEAVINEYKSQGSINTLSKIVNV